MSYYTTQRFTQLTIYDLHEKDTTNIKKKKKKNTQPNMDKLNNKQSIGYLFMIPS